MRPDNFTYTPLGAATIFGRWGHMADVHITVYDLSEMAAIKL